MYGAPQRRFANYLSASGMPATLTIILINVVTFFLVNSAGILPLLAFNSARWPEFFWTPITWPLAGLYDPLNLIFACGWAFYFGGSVERSWGTRTYLTFLVAVSALTAFTIWLGAHLFGNASITGLWIAMAPVVVAWCIVNSRETINLFFLPIPAPLVAVLAAAMAWFYAGGHVIGLFALSGCAAAYWYAASGRYLARGDTRAGKPFGGMPPKDKGPALRFRDFDRDPPAAGGLDPRRAFRAWQERRKLEQLWKRSGFSDPDEKDKHRR